MITIVIVEDQGILRESLACTLNLQEDMQVARALSDAADALDVVRETNANLALLDVCTENGSSGIAAAKQIHEACPDTKIVIMTGMPEITFIEQAKLAGADSFVYKNVGTEELLGIIRSTANGYSTFRMQPRVSSRTLRHSTKQRSASCDWSAKQKRVRKLQLSCI